jgi:metal-responsive CopG/Arc/MetJ family transcriptional regulator
MSNQKIVGISFPKSLFEELDKQRGDVPRSTYIQRLLEKQFEVQNK